MVTTTGSGLSVPDWPLSFGRLNPRMVGGVFFEHGHRLVAAAVGFLTLIAAFWASLVQAPRFVRRAAWFALGLVILQGLLGGLTVLMKLPTAVSVAHGCTAQLFLCTIVALVLLTTPAFVDADCRITGPSASSLRLGSVTALIIVFLQLVVGATMRHMGAGLIIPDFPTSMGRLVPPLVTLEICINFAHRCLAVMVLLAVGLLVARIYREHSQQPALPKLALGLSGLVLVQITLGALTVWSRRGLFPTSLHVMNGALVLATTFAIVLWSYRLTSARRQSGIVETTATGTRADWMELAKMRLVTLSAFTAGCGYWLSTSQPRWSVLAMVVVGIFLLGGGSSVLNHVFEVETDALMARTRNRPLPAGRVSTVMAERVGAALGLGGVLFLGVAVRPLCGILALLAMVSYLFIYTPLKRTTPMCTLVGAVPGALPVLIGWTAGTGRLDIGGWILFLILFVWQLPHFMAIAWLCREDYAKAGLPMLTVVDPAGGLASLQTLVYCLALVPISLAPTLYGMTGLLYSFIALVLGVIYLVFGVRMSRERTTVRARQLLMASVIYLPLLYGAMMINR
ncbi:MAG: heme o synthase [Vulcanimicrobiota bacterium]